MFTLGYNKYYNSLYKQNLEPKFGLFLIPSPEESTVLDHLNSKHNVNVSSADIYNNLLSYQIQKGLTSDSISDGKFMKDFNPDSLNLVIDKLGYGMLEGAAHYYFTENKYLLVVDSTVAYTKVNKGRSFFISSYRNIRFRIGTPVGKVFPDSFIRLHSPAAIDSNNVDLKLNKLSLTEISPDVYQNNPVEIYNTHVNLDWYRPQNNPGLYQLDPDALPPKGFFNPDEITAHPTVQSMKDHINLDDIHPGSWTKPGLSDRTTVSSSVINSMYSRYTLNSRPSTGDWFVSPDKKSYSYEAELGEEEGHWLAISIGDPNAIVTDPDDPNIILAQCVNGTDEMRCYFKLGKDKFPVATSTVLLRRCNPIRGFTALTLSDVSN